MDLTPYVEQLREQLTFAANAADGDIREAVERVLNQLEPSARLAFIAALSESTDLITQMLNECGAPAYVQLTMSGQNPGFLVQYHPGTRQPAEPSLADLEAATQRFLDMADGSADDDTTDDEPDTTTRMTLRLPDSVKRLADAAAAERGVSLNTFITDAVRAAVEADGHRGRRGNRERRGRRGRRGGDPEAYGGWAPWTEADDDGYPMPSNLPIPPVPQIPPMPPRGTGKRLTGWL